MKKQDKFESVGYITVDAGIIQIGDPCYQMKDKHWQKYIEDVGIVDMTDGSLSIPHETGMPGKAIVVQSGFGDGIYDVLVKKCSKTGIVKELKIKFI